MFVSPPSIIRNKRRDTAAIIREWAREIGPGGKLPTVREISARLSVAKATVDEALGVLETRDEIRRKQGSGIYVQPAIRQKTLGVVFGGDIFASNYSPFWNLLLLAVRQQSAGREIRPRAYMDIAGANSESGSHQQLAEDLQAERLDALLLIAPQANWQDLRFVRELTIPLVTLDSRDTGWVACFDFKAFLRLAAQETAAQTRSGRVAVMGVEPHLEFLELELKRAGHVRRPVLDWSYHRWASLLEGVGNFESCAHKTISHLSSSKDLDALPEVIVSTDDTMTRGAIMALHEAGIVVGQDIKIITASNVGSPVLSPYSSIITRFDFDPAECISSALDMIEKLTNGDTPPERITFIPPHPPAGSK